MSYTTPIFDRTAADLIARNSKAFFNVADWDRIEDNVIAVRDELIFDFGISIVLTGTTSAPAITSIPDVDDFNRLLENLEQVRQAAESVLPTLTITNGFYEVAHDWVAGVAQNAPDYIDVNHWEEVISIIHTGVLNAEDFTFRFPRTGIAIAGADLNRNNGWRA